MKKTRITTEAEVIEELNKLYEDCLDRTVDLADGMPRLIKWAHRYEEVTGTNELSTFLFPYYHVNGLLMFLCNIARNDTLTTEQRIKEIQVATSEIESTPPWYWRSREVFYPMGFWDFFGLVGKVKDMLKQDWFRKTIERTELEEEIEEDNK